MDFLVTVVMFFVNVTKTVVSVLSKFCIYKNGPVWLGSWNEDVTAIYTWQSCKLIWHSEDRASWYILIIKTNKMLFYLQHVLQFNHNVHVYTLVILLTFKIAAWQIPIAVYTVWRFLMTYDRPVRNM
jgi:hypothetical protein